MSLHHFASNLPELLHLKYLPVNHESRVHFLFFCVQLAFVIHPETENCTHTLWMEIIYTNLATSFFTIGSIFPIKIQSYGQMCVLDELPTTSEDTLDSNPTCSMYCIQNESMCKYCPEKLCSRQNSYFWCVFWGAYFSPFRYIFQYLDAFSGVFVSLN